MQHFTLDDDLSQKQIARALLGETVKVAARTPAANETEPMKATAVTRIESPLSTGYREWDLDTALAKVEPIQWIADLSIPSLTEAEFDAFLQVVQR